MVQWPVWGCHPSDRLQLEWVSHYRLCIRVRLSAPTVSIGIMKPLNRVYLDKRDKDGAFVERRRNGQIVFIVIRIFQSNTETSQAIQREISRPKALRSIWRWSKTDIKWDHTSDQSRRVSLKEAYLRMQKANGILQAHSVWPLLLLKFLFV